jgi:predicted nucleic acid-binding protein
VFENNRPKKGCHLRLYLDACCLNRLTDDQSQARIRDEAEAVEAIFRMIRTGKAVWVSSTALEIEINRNPDADRRHDVAALLVHANEVVVPQSRLAERAALLQKLGFDAFDALHLACAEEGRANVFLTTDDDLVRRANRWSNEIHTRVINPVFWYQEVTL